MTRLGRIDSTTPRLPVEPPVVKRPLRQRLLRWMVSLMFLSAVGASAWFVYFRVVAIAIVEGEALTISTPGAVIVEDLHVEPGQWCPKGQPLISLVARDAEAKRKVFEAHLRQTQLRLELASRGAELGDVRLGRRLDDRDRLEAELKAAQAALRRAGARLDHARHQLEWCRSLYQRDHASGREVEEARTMVITAEADLAEARANLEGLRAVSQRHQRLIPDQPGAGSLRDLELAFLEAAVVEARQRLRDFDYETGTRTIAAPFDGRIDRIYVRRGSHREKGDPLLSIYDPASLHVTAYVDPADHQRLHVGSTVRMYPEGSWKSVPGTVAETHAGWSRLPSSIRKSVDEVLPAITMRIETDEAGRSRLAPNMLLKVVP